MLLFRHCVVLIVVLVGSGTAHRLTERINSSYTDDKLADELAKRVALPHGCVRLDDTPTDEDLRQIFGFALEQDLHDLTAVNQDDIDGFIRLHGNVTEEHLQLRRQACSFVVEEKSYERWVSRWLAIHMGNERLIHDIGVIEWQPGGEAAASHAIDSFVRDQAAHPWIKENVEYVGSSAVEGVGQDNRVIPATPFAHALVIDHICVLLDSLLEYKSKSGNDLKPPEKALVDNVPFIAQSLWSQRKRLPRNFGI